MIPSSVVLAVALITSPELPKDVQPDVVLLKSMQSVALSMELMDKRECRYVLSNKEDFDADLKLMHRRYEELGDAPPLCDAIRFPERSLCNELIQQNRVYRQWLDARNQLGSSLAGDYIHDAIRECDILYQAWDTVRDAQCGYYYVTVRRQALKKLRDQLGYPNYYAGFMPPHVPVWRFRRIE